MSYMDYNLFACPFCAANVKEDGHTWLNHNQDHYFTISCSCGANGPKKDNKEKAMMAWNTRECSIGDFPWNPFDFQKHSDLIDLKGKLKSVDFSSILQILLSEDKTGVLQLSQGQKISALCLKDGQVIAASSNYGPQLGQILFDKGLISLENLQKVLENAKESGKRLGETLLNLGYISQDSLRGVISQQIEKTIQELIRWQDGTFQYRDCPIEFDERGIGNINIMGMMLDALRISDELADIETSSTASLQEINIA